MKKVLISLFLFLSFQSLFAFGWPVFDLSTMIQMIKVYDTNMRILQSTEAEVLNTKNELVSMTQPTNWSNMFDSPEDIESSLYTAQTWQDALEGKTGGTNQVYSNALQSFKADHPAITEKSYEHFHSPTQYKHFNEMQETVKTVSATSQTEYASTDKYVKKIREIGQEASSAKNTGLKTAMDLNTRMLEQIGFLIAAQIRLQSANNNLKADQASQSIDHQNFISKFYAKKDS